MKTKFARSLILCLTMSVASVLHGQVTPANGKNNFEINLDRVVSFGNKKINVVSNQQLIYRGSLSLSPDLRSFIGRYDDTELVIKDIESGNIRTVKISHRADYAMFSDDSKYAVISAFGGTSVTVINVELGEIASVVAAPHKLDKVTISPDGQRIATSRDEVKLLRKGRNVVNLWDANDGSLIASINGCGMYDKAPRFSLDSRMLLVDCKKVNNKPTKVFDAQTGKEVLSLAKKYKSGNTELWSDIDPESVFSPDSKTIVSIVRFGGIRIWDVESAELKAEFVATRSRWLSKIIFSPEEKSFATLGFSTVVRTWKIENGDLIRDFTTPITKSPAFFIRAVFSSDGKMLAGIDTRGRVTVWDVNTGDVKLTLNETATKEDFSVQAYFGLDDKVLYVRGERSLKAIVVDTGKIFGEIPNPTGVYYVSDDGKKVFVQDASSISEWRVNVAPQS